MFPICQPLKVLLICLQSVFLVYLFQVFVANPNKPQEVKVILAKNHEKLLELLHNLSVGKGYSISLAMHLLDSLTLTPTLG